MQSPTKTEFTGIIRPAYGAKTVLKEKFVEIYESFFKGNDPSAGQPNFWSELFLLKVNVVYLLKCLSDISQDQLLAIKNNISKLFLKSIETMKEENVQRKINAIDTLCALLQGIFSKKFNNFSFEVINLLTGLNNADTVFPKFVDAIKCLMNDGETAQVKYDALRLTIVVVCGNSNINQNSLNGYFMKDDIFDPLINIMLAPETSHVAYEAIMLLDILANYNKHESKNPYLIKLINLKNEAVFEKIMNVLATTCVNCRSKYIDIQDDDEANKYFVSSLASYVGSILSWTGNGTKKHSNVSDPELAFVRLPSANVSIILVFYDLLNNNKRFVDHLAKSIVKFPISAESKVNGRDSTTIATENGKESIEMVRDGPYFCEFLSISSYILQHNRTNRTASYANVILLILVILVEDSTFNKVICEDERRFIVRLCRQRPPLLQNAKFPRPLVGIILDVVIGFINHNLRRKLQTDLYSMSLGVIHRIMSYLKKNCVRLPYHWSEIWQSLIGLLKFILSNIEYFQQDRDSVNEVLLSAINIINLSVTFGDSFFPDPISYDNLFYEIIRAKETFDGLSSIVNKTNFTKLGSPTKSAFQKPMSSSQFDVLSNINTICTHFSLKIEGWKLTNRVKSITPEQVAIINANYDTLELVTPEKLDHYTPYNEIPYHVPLLRQVLRVIVEDFKRREVLLD
ncbi:11677_t:CDS:10 [Funneliformis caledonium]|uniref:11677_t:CDS:1 n=1 Tax=Funneliformis caledonium TaxID=1117310 RepID=A0A9N9FY93_9GLOM|nr:11677_t:CDS:10 [Funneliformis caledonium]